MQVKERHVSRESAMPPFQGAGPQRPKICGISYMRAHSMRNVYQILHVDQTPRCDEMKIFAGRPRMPTRDLLAVDNLVNDSISTVLH